MSLFIVSCDSKRPDEGNFEYSLTVNSIQVNADVEILDGTKSVSTGITDENGIVNFGSLNVVSNLRIKVCGGTVNLVSISKPVAWTGCNEIMFTPVEKEANSVVVDFLSTLITNYDSETSTQEWMDYLDVTTLSTPTLQTSLTDSTKRYLWLQGFAMISKNISQANGVNPETQYSTEKLINLLVADLADDNIINASTDKMFGTLSVDSAVLKNIIAEAVPEVSDSFSASDLKNWTDKLANSDAEFLGGSGNDPDGNKPVIKIIEPSGENPTVWGEVSIHVTATDDKKVASLDCGIINSEDVPDIVDTRDEPEVFSGSFDSSQIEDGELKIKCIASDGTNISEKEFSITVSNNNAVNLKAYITNALTNWDLVTINDYDGGKVGTYTFKKDEEPVLSLAPGEYQIVFKGGSYAPVFLADENIDFDSELKTYAKVVAGDITEVVATPLTTIREALRKEVGNEKSFTLISEHIDSDFPLYIEPVSKNQLTENSKYYIVLAGLERLAVLVGERHDPKLEAGAVTIEQVLKAIVDDIETIDEGVLDGNGSINQFGIDSYLFRYWYAIAVKLFLESDENLTGLGFSDLQTVINNISMDKSELFPKDKAPKKVTDQPPVISQKQFKRSFETGFQDYSLENIIYANDSVFNIKFKALPNESGDLEINLVEIFGNVEVRSLSDINNEGIYTAELTFTDEADGEKTVGIRAIDNAENTGTATLQAVKDTVIPAIDKFELLRGETLILGEYTTVPFTADYEITEANFRNAQLAVKTSVSSGNFVYDKVVSTSLVGDFQINKSDLPGDGDDGSYNFSVKFTDKAGNETTTEFQKTIDTVAPVVESIVMTPSINANGFIDSRDITVEITATDNIEQTLNYWQRRNEAPYNKNTNDPHHIFNIQEPADASIVYYFKVSDQAGNESPESDVFSFSIDTVDPVVTISNAETLEGNTYKSTSSSLVFNYTIEEINLDHCELRINGSKAYDIINFPTNTITFTGSELLDPTIGPATANTASIYCIDLAGRETQSTVSFYIDDEPPVINLDPDQLSGSVIDDDLVSVDSLITDNFGRQGNLTVKFKYVDNAFNSLGVSNTHSFPASGMREIDSWGGSGGRASCSTSDDSCRFWIPHIDDSYLNQGNYDNLYHNNNNFTLFLEATDKAGNKSETTFSYTVDKEPVPMNSGGYSYEDGKIYLGFSSDRYIYGFRMRVNGHYSDAEFYHTYLDKIEKHFYSCRFNANTGTTYNVTVSSKDWFGNASFDGCSQFQSTGSNFCFQGNIKATLPSLSVIISNQTNSSVYYDISSDSTIIDCRILKKGSFFQNCDKSTGNFTKDIGTWEEGVYTITATAKNSVGAETTRSDDFRIDNTVTSFDLEIQNYNQIYLNSAPTLLINASIAGGVKSVRVYLEKRKLHRARSGDLSKCVGSYCYQIFQSKIAEQNPMIFVNPLSFQVYTIFSPITPSPDLFEPGYYDSIRWVITSNRNGESESGHFYLADTPIRIAKSQDDFAQVLSISVNEDNEELEVEFRPSVFSTANLSSTADFDLQVLSNPDINSSSNYYQICGDNNTSFKKQYRHYESKIKVTFDRLSYSYSTKKYTAYFKPNLDSYRYNHNIPNSNNYFAYAPCDTDSDCPVDSEHYKVSSGCHYLYEWNDDPGAYLCEPNYCKHYASDHDISSSKICNIYSGGSCTEYYKTCPDPASTFFFYYYQGNYNYIEECPLLRDFWYFPKDLKIKVVDDFNKSDTITLSSDYTDPTECPQYKELDSF